MNSGRPNPAAQCGSEAVRAEALRGELATLLGRQTGGSDGRHETAIPELKLYRFSHPTEPAPVLQQPAVYVVVQGRKQVTVGDETYVYDPSQYLAVSVDLPAVAHVVEASPEEPYLCMTLTVDARELAALIVETGRQAPRDDHDGRALYVSPLQAPLLDAFLRLVQLLDAPQDVSVLAPLILRELHYRLLRSEQFGRLAQIAIGDGRLRRVSGAIDWIKEHFAEPLRIEALAKRVHMSPSALHSHFKAVAAMSPIQYQKRLRLLEARRLLLSGAASAEAIAYDVGYASASQFSREYLRLFGQPPRRDAQRMREAVSSGGPLTSAMRRSKFSRNTNQARSAVKTPSRFSSREAAEADVERSPRHEEDWPQDAAGHDGPGEPRHVRASDRSLGDRHRRQEADHGQAETRARVEQPGDQERRNVPEEQLRKRSAEAEEER
jgi:AraC-like DNA-binding protein